MIKVLTGSNVMKNTPDVSWVWPGLIPRKFITILASRGGVGKSGFALWLANELSSDTKKILYVDAERCGSHIAQRLRSWNLENNKNILFTTEELDDGTVETAAPSTEAELMAIIKEEKPELVILDSLTIFARQLDTNKREAIAKYFETLTKTASLGNTGILLLAHEKKKTSDDAELNLDCIAGSAAISDLARSVLMLDYGTKDNTRILYQRKSNFSKLHDDMTFEIHEDGIKNFTTVSNTKIRKTGSKADQFRDIAINCLQLGMTKKEAREELKALGASTTEHKRAIDYASSKLSIEWIEG